MPATPTDSTGFGGVSYGYHIGTHEVTNGQYASFLNSEAFTDDHGLYKSIMGSNIHGGIDRSGASGSFSYSVKSGFENKPVNMVSYWDAVRFTNWLTSGDTETGVYNLDATGISNNTITRDATAWATGGVAIASENEWYKAAYYDGNGGYYDFPTQSNSITTADANYSNSVGTVTDVGAYTESASHYGTFDQGGNLWEWIDAVSNSDRGQRGGSFDFNSGNLQASKRDNADPNIWSITGGFRVSSLAPIPEPSTYAAIVGGLGLSLALIRRKRRGAL